MVSITEYYNDLRHKIAHEVGKLPPKERFDRLRKYILEQFADCATRLADHTVGLDSAVEDTIDGLTAAQIEDFMEGRAQFPLDLQKITRKPKLWAHQASLFLYDIQELMNLSFDTHVKLYVTAQVARFKDFELLSSFGRNENFPLFISMRLQHQVRMEIATAPKQFTVFADRASEYADEYSHYQNRVQTVSAFTERFIRMRHFDKTKVNDIKNQIIAALGPLPASDGIHFVTPILARIKKPDFVGLPELEDINSTIERKKWLVKFLETHGRSNSRALKEERQYLGDLLAVKKRYDESLASLVEEYKGMVGIDVDSEVNPGGSKAAAGDAGDVQTAALGAEAGTGNEETGHARRENVVIDGETGDTNLPENTIMPGVENEAGSAEVGGAESLKDTSDVGNGNATLDERIVNNCVKDKTQEGLEVEGAESMDTRSPAGNSKEGNDHPSGNEVVNGVDMPVKTGEVGKDIQNRGANDDDISAESSNIEHTTHSNESNGTAVPPTDGNSKSNPENSSTNEAQSPSGSANMQHDIEGDDAQTSQLPSPVSAGRSMTESHQQSSMHGQEEAESTKHISQSPSGSRRKGNGVEAIKTASQKPAVTTPKTTSRKRRNNLDEDDDDEDYVDSKTPPPSSKTASKKRGAVNESKVKQDLESRKKVGGNRKLQKVQGGDKASGASKPRKIIKLKLSPSKTAK